MSSGQNGKGSARRPAAKSGTYEQNHAAINWSPEYRIVADDGGALYVIDVDESTIFTRWLAARRQQRHFPADFTPHSLLDAGKLRFKQWREEES